MTPRRAACSLILAFCLLTFEPAIIARAVVPNKRFNLRVSLVGSVASKFRILNANSLAFGESPAMPQRALGWYLRMEVPPSFVGSLAKGSISVSVPGSAHRETLKFNNLVLGGEFELGSVLSREGSPACGFEWAGPTSSNIIADAVLTIKAAPVARPVFIAPKALYKQWIASDGVDDVSLDVIKPFTVFQIGDEFVKPNTWNSLYLSQDFGGILTMFVVPPGTPSARVSGRWKDSLGSQLSGKFELSCDHA
jgi:hypothetical protein